MAEKYKVIVDKLELELKRMRAEGKIRLLPRVTCAKHIPAADRRYVPLSMFCSKKA